MNIIKLIVMPCDNQLADIDTFKSIIMTLDNQHINTTIFSLTKYEVVVTPDGCLYYLLICLVKQNLVIVPS